MSLLDDSLTSRAAPPGSMRYFSVLYAPAALRPAMLALYVVDAEIRESAENPNHDVAHTRLQWWRAEIDRLINGSPQHPATRVLHEQRIFERGTLDKLHELVAAADMDLARMTYSNPRELRAYCVRSSGIILELIATALQAPQALSEPQRVAAIATGIGVRQTEILRDLRRDASHGRVYLPLDSLDAHGLGIDDLRASEVDTRLRQALTQFRQAAQVELEPVLGAEWAQLRPLAVLAALHHRLLDRIAARNYDVASERIELGALEKPWVAWRAARNAGRHR